MQFFSVISILRHLTTINSDKNTLGNLVYVNSLSLSVFILDFKFDNTMTPLL